MNLYIQNVIEVDGQVERLEQVYPVELTIKQGAAYLTYHNEEKERVVLKCQEKELLMTRFSTPKTVLQFSLEEDRIVRIPTPIGWQVFETQTSAYSLDMDQQEILLHYTLKNGESTFATYQMTLKWGQ